MAAPSTTTWGSIVTGDKDTRQGKIGIYTGVTTTNTQVKVTVQVWFASKYSIDDSNNEYYYNSGATTATTKIGAVDINHTVATGGGWSTSNQTKLGESSYAYNRTKAAYTVYYAAKLAGIDILGSAMTVSTGVIVPALESYAVKYNANGGSGAPSAQTKWYGEVLVLSRTKPSRTGYTFQGWAMSATGGVAYAAGANYTANAAVTLYAVWKANTYTVTYDANGGSGAPSAQTKTYGKTLTLSSAVPTRNGYIFKGWATSSTAVTATLQPGGTYTQEGNVTLYAVWLLGYKPPRIYNVSVKRCLENGELDDAGTYASVSFDWDSDKTVRSIEVHWAKTGTNVWSGPITITASGTSGVGVSIKFGSDDITSVQYLDSEVTYDIRITVTDDGGSNDAVRSLFSQKFTIDFVYEKVLDQNGVVQSESTGVAFGKTAELVDAVEFAYDAKFNKPVYGKALGMDRLPAIPANSNFNDYIEPGCYAVQTNAVAQTCSNIPTDQAGRLEVWSSTGEGVRAEEWSYIRQRYVPYRAANAVWERDITRSDENVWDYGEWWRSSLTPTASARLYDEPVVLFSGSSSDTITLSQSAANFAYLEIFFTDNNGEKGGYTKLHSPYNAVIDLWIVEAGGNTDTYIRRTYYTLSDNILTPDTTTAGYAKIASAVSHTVGTNYIKITRVLGRNS